MAPVVTDVGDAGNWIKEGVNGFTVPTRDPVMLADKIIYMLQNKDLMKRFGAANRLIIKEKADYYMEMEKMRGIYESLIEENKK